MSYLIAIDAKNNQILHPEALKLLDSFMALSEKEMLFVVLFCDYSSIYKQLPEHERKRRAMWHAFNENESELIETPRIQAAIIDYNALQYNPKIELARRYQKKIDSLLETLDLESAATSGQNTIKFIDSLRSNIRELEKEVDSQYIAEGVIKGERQLSWLEKKLANKKEYKIITAKK